MTKIIDPKTLPPRDCLSARSKALWAFIVPKHVRTPTRMALLDQALLSLDRADQCREQVDRDGMTKVTESTKAIHVHPLLKAEKDSRQLFARLWEQLGLTFNQGIDVGKFQIGESGPVVEN